ncbi:MAG: hypothetical protein V2A55_02555 [Candidatus Jorgensenbacteria bacterium]
MSKKAIIIALVVIILLVGGYFIFIKSGSTPVTGQPEQTNPIAYTDAPAFAPSFLQCSPSELKIPFTGNNTYVITVFGVENGNCHYAVKVVDQNDVVIQGGVVGIDCNVPEGLITEDVLGHLFGVDKAEGKEAVKAVQDKVEADYCKSSGQ